MQKSVNDKTKHGELDEKDDQDKQNNLGSLEDTKNKDQAQHHVVLMIKPINSEEFNEGKEFQIKGNKGCCRKNKFSIFLFMFRAFLVINIVFYLIIIIKSVLDIKGILN